MNALAPRLENVRPIGGFLSEIELALLDCEPVAQHNPTHAKLFALGIHGPASTGRSPFNALRCEAVCFLPGGRFEFARDMRDASGHALAIIIPVRDEDGETIDLVAWRTRYGRAGDLARRGGHAGRG